VCSCICVLGVEVNAKNSFGETPVHQAVFNPSLKTVMLDLLRKESADMNVTSESGETPLHYAVRLGREGTPLYFSLFFFLNRDLTLVGVFF